MKTFTRGLLALSIIVATLSAAGTAYASPSVTARCDTKTGAAVVVSFDTDRAAARWALYSEAGGSIVFGETDSVPTDISGSWTQTVAVDPGVEYTWAVTTADVVEGPVPYSYEWVNEETASMVFTCNPDPANEVQAEEYFRPTPVLVTSLGWLRDVYSRDLDGCSNIGVKGFGPC